MNAGPDEEPGAEPDQEWCRIVEAEHRRRWLEITNGPRPSAARALLAGVVIAALGLGGAAAVEVLQADRPAGAVAP